MFIRCFVDKQGIENQITEKLGNGFSRAPFATVVVRNLTSQGPHPVQLQSLLSVTHPQELLANCYWCPHPL